jgi:hypothetical protein
LGGILLHLKIAQLDKCRTCLSLVASVANVIGSCYHNDDTKKTLETSYVVGLKEETGSLESNISQHLRGLLNQGFGRGTLP